MELRWRRETRASRGHMRAHGPHKKKNPNEPVRAVLTFNLVFGQVHRRAVGEDVRDGADPPVHQRGGDRMHRHDCDLWLAAARALVVHERLQQTAEGAQQLPPTVAERGAGERVHGWGAGRGGAAGDGGFLRSVFANLFRFRTGEKGEVRGRGGWVRVGVRPRKCRMGEGGGVVLPHGCLLLMNGGEEKKTSSRLMRKVSRKSKLPRWKR